MSIEERPGAAQVVESVFFKEASHPSGVPCRDLRGCQPPLQFGAKILKRRDAIGFQPRVAE